MSRISKDLKTVPKQSSTIKDIGLAVVGFPLMVMMGTTLWVWSIVHALRERISILVHGDRSKNGE